MLQQRLREGRVHARGGLVEHDEARVGHERARHLQQLALAAGERARLLRGHVRDAELVQQLPRARLHARLLAAPAPAQERAFEPLPALRLRGHGHVLQHRQPRERLRQLEGADHAQPRDAVGRAPVEPPPVQPPRPPVGLVEAREQVEERRLARPIRPDDGGDRPALDLEVVDVDRADAAEGLEHPERDQDGVVLQAPRRGRFERRLRQLWPCRRRVAHALTSPGAGPCACRRCPVAGAPSIRPVRGP